MSKMREFSLLSSFLPWRWLDSITETTDMDLRKLQEVVGDRGAWRATVHWVIKSQVWLSNYITAVGSCSSWYHFRPHPVYLFILLFCPDYEIFTPPMTFLGYVCVLISSTVSSCLWPHVFSLLGSSVHEFSRQEYWSGLPFSPPGDLPNPGIKPPSLASPALAGHPFTSQSVSLVAQLCPTLCNPMDCSMPGFPSITSSWSLLKLLSIESVMPSNHLILCHPLLLLPSIFPSIRVSSSESVLCIRCQSIGVSASAWVLPKNIQDWFPLGLTSLISLPSKELSRVFSNATVPKHQFFSTQLCL